MLGDQDIYDKKADPVVIRRRVGMVFQKPNPFSKSIYENVAWGARINGFKGDMDELVERSLRHAALWDEVKDRLKESGYDLSGGQQQRLCIARTLAGGARGDSDGRAGFERSTRSRPRRSRTPWPISSRATRS